MINLQTCVCFSQLSNSNHPTRFNRATQYTESLLKDIQCNALIPNLPAMTQMVNVLISGANRGLGKGLVQRFLLKPNHTVIAANRRTDEASSQPLQDFPVGTGSRLIIVRCDASVNTDPARAVEELQAQGVDHLDIVVANAGIAQGYPLVKDGLWRAPHHSLSTNPRPSDLKTALCSTTAITYATGRTTACPV
jgi:hypothetical protein